MSQPIGTAIYLEGFNGNKPGNPGGFKDLPKKDETKTTEFAKKTGPGSSEGFRKNGTIGDDPAAKKGDAPQEPPRFSQGTEKTGGKKINNSRRNKLMSEKKITTPKSEFDRLCEEVLGPDEVELGIEETPEAHEGAEPGSPEHEAEEMSAVERLRGILTDLEAVLAELEGTHSEEGAGVGAPEGDEMVEGSPSAASPDVAKESVEAEEVGTPISGNMKKGKPDAVTGRANVVDGEASKTNKAKGDGKIQGNRDGSVESGPDGDEAVGTSKEVGKPKASMAVKSKIHGKNQNLFNV